MHTYARSFILLLVFLLLGSNAITHAQPAQQTGTRSLLFIPFMSSSAPPNPFGFDLRIDSSTEALAYGAATRPKWARAGDVDWSQIEPVPGEYHWEVLAGFESNVRRLRAAGIEPIGIIQRSPSWAQSVPGRLCSPPSRDHIADFARFSQALAARYAQGELAVNYWEVWNEPDVEPKAVTDQIGVGCWADDSKPDAGGGYYGEVLKQVYTAIKQGNPRATILAGSMLYGVSVEANPTTLLSQRFLRGMLDAGIANSFDGLSFHAYGEYAASSLLLIKVMRIRAQLAAYGLQQKPLYATEIAAMCAGDAPEQCSSSYADWLGRQANFAARIYAEAIALNLDGAFWFSLSSSNPGFRFSHLIDESDGALAPRPAYYAFRNSARLLAGANYIGPPLVELAPDQLEDVQVLPFRKVNSTMYVMWVPRLDFPKTTYILSVPPGARAICTQKLSSDKPYQFDCSDSNKDGIINLAVISVPQYIEVFDS